MSDEMEIIEDEGTKTMQNVVDLMESVMTEGLAPDEKIDTVIVSDKFNLRRPGDPTVIAEIDLVVLAFQHMQGMKLSTSAEYFGVPVEQLKMVKARPRFRTVMAALTKSTTDAARSFLAGAAVMASKTLIHLLDSPIDKVRLGAAVEILDRVGVIAQENVHVSKYEHAVVNPDTMSAEDLLRIVRTSLLELPEGRST